MRYNVKNNRVKEVSDSRRKRDKRAERERLHEGGAG